MLDELAEVRFFEGERRKYESFMLQYKAMRDLWIVHAFEAGNRQRDIGHVCGLSESTVKHIIAVQKKL